MMMRILIAMMMTAVMITIFEMILIMMVLVIVMVLVKVIILVKVVMIVMVLAMIRVLMMAVMMLSEAINPTRLIASDRSGSQRISATTKFDVPGGLKGRKRPLLLIASGNKICFVSNGIRDLAPH